MSGALAGAMASVAAGFLVSLLGPPAGFPGAAVRFRGYLASGGWIVLPCWGAALGAWQAARRAARRRERTRVLALAVILFAVPLVFHPAVAPEPPGRMPVTREAKVRVIRRWSYLSPGGVRRIVVLSRDADSWVREQAVLALGVNLVVSDLEAGTPARPSRFAGDPLQDTLRSRLAAVLAGDPEEAVRVEAAHALWRSPRAFGRVRAAAETLAAALDRAPRPGAPSRALWLALDAAAGAPDSGLKEAARRLAAHTGDPALRRAAAQAGAWDRPGR